MCMHTNTHSIQTYIYTNTYTNNPSHTQQSALSKGMTMLISKNIRIYIYIQTYIYTNIYTNTYTHHPSHTQQSALSMGMHVVPLL